MIPSEQYWTFDLSPFVFQVKNLNFSWVTTWWGILSLIVIFGGGFFLIWNQIKKYKYQLEKSNSEKNNSILSKKIHNLEFIQTSFLYFFAILVILYILNIMKINWGLRWYSTMYLIGFISVYVGCMIWIRKKTLMLTENMLMNLITLSIIGMLVGARSAYVFVYNWDYYKTHPWEAIATWEGGLSFHGGIVGVSLAMMYYCYKNKIPFFHLTDKLVRIIPIGIGMGRIGNFLNGELWGRPIESHIPWGIIFPEGGNIARHPSQIYQSLAEGWGLFLTLYIISRWKQKEGTLSACFIIFYSLYRFMVEYFRAADKQINYFYLSNFSWNPLNAYPDVPWWQVLTMGQLLCFCFLIAGCIFLYFTRKNILEFTPEWLKRNDNFFKRINLEVVKK
ncbi:prolipoprotein diacylglyceryl transferase [Silvanigrella aquatica]|uniref:Phosphatidylglycerol--prolipoprotein diacylglyceryl transferase n=1 Tax=Silvanigrella aquatica TaxID=1915309 RepID=A0A1L4D2H5_9BACT|nr:prolipoprotein diacylglyceryl transferase [Silvanigrella aquatica]APJ04391.1 prolipoprotein diacylglyceryl transferase [Silvanigrella aquatica]